MPWTPRLKPTPFVNPKSHRRRLSDIPRLLQHYRKHLIIILFLTLLEIYLHTRRFSIPRPDQHLDLPFSNTCHDQIDPVHGLLSFHKDEPPTDARLPRENATIVMLARNSDLEGARSAMASLEDAFNRFFRYPVIFLNDQPFSPEFVDALRNTVSGETFFETIPQHMWSYPAHIDQPRARASMRRMSLEHSGPGGDQLPYAGSESYHHMCRFNAGFFFDHPRVARYKWYWRVEPDVEYTCHIPYDPFKRMRAHGKVYGYALALWEVGATSPGLYRAVADYAHKHRVKPPGRLWAAMKDPSWAPLPIRRLILPYLTGTFHSRDRHGDPWNMCHYWSNFEIADLDFFRSAQYRGLFEQLDSEGGFYYERWGDAPVHSLAVSLFLADEQVHYFGDVGYRHPPFQLCPAKGRWRRKGEGLGGCRCDCDPTEGRVPDTCLKRLREAVEPPWR